MLEKEPELPDGTEVDVVLPDEWEAQRNLLRSIGCYPEFGSEVEQAQKSWTPERF